MLCGTETSCYSHAPPIVRRQHELTRMLPRERESKRTRRRQSHRTPIHDIRRNRASKRGDTSEGQPIRKERGDDTTRHARTQSIDRIPRGETKLTKDNECMMNDESSIIKHQSIITRQQLLERGKEIQHYVPTSRYYFLFQKPS